MLKLNDCPRCKKGTVRFDRDQYGWYEYCILCGHLRDLTNIVELGQQPACDRKEQERRVRASSEGK